MFACLTMGSGSIIKCGFGVGVALVEGICYRGSGLKVSSAQVMHTTAYSFLILLAVQDVELGALSPVHCLPGHCDASHHGDNGLNL